MLLMCARVNGLRLEACGNAMLAPTKVITVVDTSSAVSYGWHMIKIVMTTEFDEWLEALRDAAAKARISGRIVRLANGNPGQVNDIGNGLSELKIDHGPGYRVYYMQRGRTLIVLLCGGDKSDQRRDIKTAKALAKEWKDKNND